MSKRFEFIAVSTEPKVCHNCEYEGRCSLQTFLKTEARKKNAEFNDKEFGCTFHEKPRFKASIE